MKKLIDKLKNIKFIETLKKNNKYKPVLYSLLILLFMGIIGTVAYFSSSVGFSNIFKTSGYDVDIEEEFYNDWGTKKVSIVNNDDTSVVLRINFVELWQDNNGEYLNNKFNKQDVVTKNWTDEWLNNFSKGSDGWYYYKKILNKGDRVQILNSIYLNESLNETELYNSYLASTYELDFSYEAVQADNKAIEKVWGQTPNINGNIVNWF